MTIDFKAIAQAALAQIDHLLNDWLPGGKTIVGNWVVKNPVRDESHPSFSVSLSSGAWFDYASEDAGGDLISLYAYIHGCGNGEAARAVASIIGFALSDQGGLPARIVARSAPAPEGVDAPTKAAKVSPWQPIVPVPPDAGAYPVAHLKRGRPEASWEYRDQAGQLLGVIYRFKTSSGGKEVLPCVFAVNADTGIREWHWMAFPEPRPLYLRGPLQPGKKVLLVEGEKCVDAAIALFGERFNVTSWPGGGKAVDKVDWSPLAGYEVIAWPDCDAQKDRTGTVLPAARQPGLRAMERAAELLIPLGCEMRLVDIPAPGDKPSGWDIADAITLDGWDAATCLEFIRTHLRKPACMETPAPPPGPIATSCVASPPPGAGAGQGRDAPGPESGTPVGLDEGPIDWDRILYKKMNGAYEECRENVFEVLQRHPAWQGVVGYDQFAARIMKRKPTPFGSPVGEWTQEDDDQLGLWLVRNVGLLVKSNEAIVRGVSMVAHQNRFHPLRMYLESLQWDGVRRNHCWLREAFAADCSARDADERTRRARYLELAGQIFLICMVKLAYEPGSHYCLILEGIQGEGKSKALRALGGEWFCDTPFARVGDQNSYMAIQGAWLYEIAELDAFNRSDTTAIKAFMTQPVDRYREPYERRLKDRPRQTAFAGTTNNREYLKDETGNRRFFPVDCRGVNQEWIKMHRDQLFAEALHDWRHGVKPYPSREDERAYFFPEQEAREIGDPWTEKIYRYLYQDVDGCLLNKVTTYDLLTKAIGMTADKIDGNRSMATRIGKAMKRLQWGQERASAGLIRERFYTRPRERDEASGPYNEPGSEDEDVAL